MTRCCPHLFLKKKKLLQREKHARSPHRPSSFPLPSFFSFVFPLLYFSIFHFFKICMFFRRWRSWRRGGSEGAKRDFQVWLLFPIHKLNSIHWSSTRYLIAFNKTRRITPRQFLVRNIPRYEARKDRRHKGVVCCSYVEKRFGTTAPPLEPCVAKRLSSSRQRWNWSLKILKYLFGRPHRQCDDSDR